MKQYSLTQIFHTPETNDPNSALPPMPCALCGGMNRVDTVYPDPVFGSPQKQLAQFTCVHCGFFQEDVV
ncbi:MAG: hypothetical protein JWL86_5583 [Rhizobium sp.]|nr:hypothetical protein [Rhizobium sp.]